MHPLLKRSGNMLLLGDLAIVRGALEAGVGFASSYPGTPASEIGDAFAEIAKEAGIYFEWSTNEKVAFETAAAAAMSGVRSIVSFKHFGWNVASDSIYPLAYLGVKAGMVIVVADDPGCWSSGQSEQDSRYLARVAHLPMLEPSDSAECKDFVIRAFKMSEKFKIPVVIRITTRVGHSGCIVKLGKIIKGKTHGTFDVDRWRTMPPRLLAVHRELHEKLESINRWAERSGLNRIVKGKGNVGVIASGVSYCHSLEAMDMLGLKLPMLKLGISWPLPEKTIINFIHGLNKVIIAEEIEPIILKEVERLAKSANPKLSVLGKDDIHSCELKPDIIALVLAKATGKKFKIPVAKPMPQRPPVLCPGCPHRATFWAAKTAVPGAVYGGDIGCYIMGIYEPLATQAFVISMGAVQGITHGIRKVSKQPAISFIGDSTFFHAGIPGLINMTWNKSDPLVIVMKNTVTAMTGHQPHAASGKTAMGEPAKPLSISEIAAACGVENIKTVNCFNIAETQSAVKELIAKPGTKLLVAEGECRLMYMRRARKEGLKVPKWQINQDKCTKCGMCVFKFGCPAIHYIGDPNNWKKGKFYIETDFCWGCSVCAQVCPAKAIEVLK
ncbi:MAG: indolepyruvate ferredoxin oxidoreductase subunit alpha [Candidatus Aenigmatarchaeota archaeon]